MNRTFLSLYLIIVASVFAFGWLADQIWRTYARAPDITEDRARLIQLVANVVKDIEGDVDQGRLDAIGNPLSLSISIYSWEDFAASLIKSKLNEGKIVAIHDTENTTLYYYLISSSVNDLSDKKVLAVSIANTKSNRWLYRFLMVGFYFLVAISVYFWVLPLTRDLKKLKLSTEKVGRDGKVDVLSLKPSSAIYSLAQTFNAMSSRIRGLLAAQKEMTHGISHELRTPLARMKFTLASLEEQNDKTKALHENIVEMEQLISQFLNYASFEARTEEVTFKRGDLALMIERLLPSTHPHIHIRIKNELKNGLVCCEWDLLEHCVKNLIQNALRYSHSRLFIQLSETDQAYFIYVNDDGPGVPECDQPYLFDAFFRSSLKPSKSTGFGLGLALVKRIMHWHKGEVYYQDSEIGGACFVLTWNKPAP